MRITIGRASTHATVAFHRALQNESRLRAGNSGRWRSTRAACGGRGRPGHSVATCSDANNGSSAQRIASQAGSAAHVSAMAWAKTPREPFSSVPLRGGAEACADTLCILVNASLFCDGYATKSRPVKALVCVAVQRWKQASLVCWLAAAVDPSAQSNGARLGSVGIARRGQRLMSSSSVLVCSARTVSTQRRHARGRPRLSARCTRKSVRALRSRRAVDGRSDQTSNTHAVSEPMIGRDAGERRAMKTPRAVNFCDDNVQRERQ